MGECVLDINRYRKIKVLILTTWVETEGNFVAIQDKVQKQFHVRPSLHDIIAALQENPN